MCYTSSGVLYSINGVFHILCVVHPTQHLVCCSPYTSSCVLYTVGHVLHIILCIVHHDLCVTHCLMCCCMLCINLCAIYWPCLCLLYMWRIELLAAHNPLCCTSSDVVIIIFCFVGHRLCMPHMVCSSV